MPASFSNGLSHQIFAPSLGEAWLADRAGDLGARRSGEFDGLPIIELRPLDLAIKDPSGHDGLIDKYGDPERIARMN